jgi:hypothetical protein
MWRFSCVEQIFSTPVVRMRRRKCFKSRKGESTRFYPLAMMLSHCDGVGNQSTWVRILMDDFVPLIVQFLYFGAYYSKATYHLYRFVSVIVYYKNE